MTSKEHLQKEVGEENSQQNRKDRFLILHNDDYHTFDYVIDALIKICEHDEQQAEQCTLLIHYKGKCDVKKGNFTTLKPLKDKLTAIGLNVTIN